MSEDDKRRRTVLTRRPVLTREQADPTPVDPEEAERYRAYLDKMIHRPKESAHERALSFPEWRE